MEEATISQTGLAEGPQLTTDDLLLLIGQKEVILLSQQRLLKAQAKEIAAIKARHLELEKKLASTQPTIDALSKTNHKLDQAITELRMENKRLTSIEQAKKQLDQQIKTLSEENNKLRQRIVALEAENKRLTLEQTECMTQRQPIEERLVSSTKRKKRSSSKRTKEVKDGEHH